ncbi:hypothetical protein OXX69_009474 [Metschnikowia pulcherrima]
MPSAKEIGACLNDSTRENLFASLSAVHTDNSLLITTREVSKLLNYLTPFSALRAKGGLEKTLLIDDVTSVEEFRSMCSAYKAFTVIMAGNDDGISHLKRLWSVLDHKQSATINLIIKDFGKAFYDSLLSDVLDLNQITFEQFSSLDTAGSIIRLTGNCNLLPWKVYPTLIHDFVFSSNMVHGGLPAYLENPLEVESCLNTMIVDILSATTSLPEVMKVKNVFSKGDHSSLLVRNFLDDKFSDLLSQFSYPQQEFYLKKLSGNTDLVVLERNIDYFPLILTPMNYMGLLDETFGVEDELNSILSTKDVMDDELYQSLKHLNFGSIGVKLNTLAKMLQSELENSDNTQDLAKIKQLMKNLGSLTSKQEMVRKHTRLSETILERIKSNTDSGTKFDSRQIWLELQNEVFELDYKNQLKKLHSMIDQCFPFEILMGLVVLISLINDGIRQNDMDHITKSFQLSFGLRSSLTLRKLFDHNIIKVNTKGSDFFGSFTFAKTEIETTTVSTSAKTSGGSQTDHDVGYEDVAAVGVSSGQDVYKSTYTLINKFWNLHPVEEEQAPGQAMAIESPSDYKQPSFALPSATVPLTARLLEALYTRDFLTYKPVNNTSRRPNWNNLNLETMLKGSAIDKNICDNSENRKLSSEKRKIEQKYVILVLLGGITKSEISVFQHLQAKLDKQILVVTTGVVNNQDFWETMK